MPTPEQKSLIDVDVRTVRAFTVAGCGGNPAGVVLDADTLTADEMQAIAARVGLSETAFVSRSRSEGARLNFFTPTRRIAHCGHATIAAFTLLRETGRIEVGETSKETVDGARRIVVEANRVFMAQRTPRYAPAAEALSLAAAVRAVGAWPEALDPEVPATVSDTGGAFLLLPLRGPDELAALRPDHPAIARIGTEAGVVGFYAFTTRSTEGAVDATTRMFAPHFGIPEESATGMAAGALGAFLHDVCGVGPTLQIEQGRYMTPAAASRIEVSLEVASGRVVGVMAGGEATVDPAQTVPA
jgi:PhzF family phenazine biosynthesis protein